MFAAATAYVFGVPMTGAVIYGISRVVMAIERSSRQGH